MLDAGTTEDNSITQFACVASRVGRFVPPLPDDPAHYSVVEQIYLLGDMYMRK